MLSGWKVTIGERIYTARKAADMEIDDLAVRLGVLPRTVANWENDRSAPRGNRLTMIAMEPAPLIAKWVGGLVNTTGLDAMDYLISDSIETPPGCDQDYYEKHPFIRIRPVGQFPSTKEVFGTNFCDIAIKVDSRTNRVTIVSVIDNLLKGAAGQAVQNMNIMLGLDETTGLYHYPIYP